MKKALVLLAAWLAPASAFAGLRMEGITEDGNTLVLSEDHGEMEGASLLLVDVRTGEKTTIQDPDEATVQALAEQQADEEVASPVDAWRKAHPLKELKPSRTSPDGKSTVDLAVKGSSGAGAFAKGVWSPKDPSTAVLTVTREGKKILEQPLGSVSPLVTAYWSPDGRRVALISQITPSMFRSPGIDDVAVFPVGGPRVQILAGRSILKKAAPKVATALDKAGYGVSFVGAAKKERDASVVYAAKGFEDAAKKLAAAVPGGATVDTLSWATNADLVVAVGTSAVK